MIKGIIVRLGVWLACWLVITQCYAEPDDLTKTWYLTSLNSVPIEVLNFPERQPYLILRDDNRYEAYAGCNQILGNYALIDERKINFSPAAVTRMACQHNMGFEEEFLKMLEKAEFWNILGEGKTLNLRSKDLEIIAVFSELAT